MLIGQCQSVMKKIPTCNFFRAEKRMNRRRGNNILNEYMNILKRNKLILKREKEDFEIEPETRYVL